VPLNLESTAPKRVYWLSLVALAVGALVILAKLPATGFKAMIDFATIISFLTAPVLAFLNHRAVMGSEVPFEARPRPWLVFSSRASIACLTAFAVYFLTL
jgi:Mn2+/Fe2+ NRAMP family transporter